MSAGYSGLTNFQALQILRFCDGPLIPKKPDEQYQGATHPLKLLLCRNVPLSPSSLFCEAPTSSHHRMEGRHSRSYLAQRESTKSIRKVRGKLHNTGKSLRQNALLKPKPQSTISIGLNDGESNTHCEFRLSSGLMRVHNLHLSLWKALDITIMHAVHFLMLHISWLPAADGAM